MAEGGSKDLLRLEIDSATASSSSKLLVCGKTSEFSRFEAPIFPVPKSQVLDKVKDFLSVFEESNKKLLDDAKENPDNYDIEVLDGKESEYIEMDLMLGIADLHTPDAVAAAEAAIAGNQFGVPLEESSSDSEDDDSTATDDEDNIAVKDDTATGHGDEDSKQLTKFGSQDADVNSSRESSKKQKPKKKPKIVELS